MKKFFKDRIADVKFLGTGPGHSLTESSRSQPQSARPVATGRLRTGTCYMYRSLPLSLYFSLLEPRRPPSDSAAAAGQAALARLDQQNPPSRSGSRKAVSAPGATAIDPQSELLAYLCV